MNIEDIVFFVKISSKSISLSVNLWDTFVGVSLHIATSLVYSEESTRTISVLLS